MWQWHVPPLAASLGGDLKNTIALLPSSSPAWSSATPDSSVGVDFLGTRAANLAMLGQLTGVFNNTIRSARQHTIVAWIAWRFLENTGNRDEVTKAQFNAFLELVETIQLVGQQEVGVELGGRTGGLGSGSYKHVAELDPVPVRFADYQRTHETSALAAVQYGPSAKPDGMGFITTPGGIPVASEGRGLSLVRALDSLLRASRHYQLLESFDAPKALARDAIIDLARHGMVIVGRDGAPRPEREPYIRALFNLDGRKADDDRAHTMALLLHWVGELNEGDGVTTQDIRDRLLAWRPEREAMPTHLDAVARRWRVFQVRQLQRFALESWLSLVEHWMHEGVKDVPSMQRRIQEALTSMPELAWLDRPASELPEHLGEAMRWVVDRKPWEAIWNDVLPALQQGDPKSAVLGVLRLTAGVLGLIRAVVPSEAGALRTYALTGHFQRISMVHFEQWWSRRGRFPLREVLAELMEELVLQQHVAVAVSRYDNENRRLRFSTGERGWELLPGTKPTLPTLTPDRVEASLDLLNDLALLVPVGERYRQVAFAIDPSGRKLCRHFAAHCSGDSRSAEDDADRR